MDAVLTVIGVHGADVGLAVNGVVADGAIVAGGAIVVVGGIGAGGVTVAGEIMQSTQPPFKIGALLKVSPFILRASRYYS